DGRLLRPYATAEGRWRIKATREDVDPRFLNVLFAYEDKRYQSHAGVDPFALGRALSQLLINGRIVSGGSTISMQVARLLEPRTERSFAAKLRQIVRAIELERSLGKDEILALYLSLAPYGGNLEGIRAGPPRLFRQGAAPPQPRRAGAAGGAAAVSGTAPARPFSRCGARRPRPCARPHRRCRACAGRRGRARTTRVSANGPQTDADAGA